MCIYSQCSQKGVDSSRPPRLAACNRRPQLVFALDTSLTSSASKESRKMGKRRHQLPERHKQALGEQIEDPETYGVRVRPAPRLPRFPCAFSTHLRHENSDHLRPHVPPHADEAPRREAAEGCRRRGARQRGRGGERCPYCWVFMLHTDSPRHLSPPTPTPCCC